MLGGGGRRGERLEEDGECAEEDEEDAATHEAGQRGEVVLEHVLLHAIKRGLCTRIYASSVSRHSCLGLVSLLSS